MLDDADHDDHEKVPLVVATRLRLDLTRADLGHPDRPDLWAELHGNCGVGVLVCAACATDSPRRYLYLRERHGHREVVEYSRAALEAAGVAESAEHRTLKDKITQLAEQQGLVAEQESGNARRSRRTDVVVSGGSVQVGWEVQLSGLKPTKLRRRITTASSDGLAPSWLTMVGTPGFTAIIDRAPACTTKALQPLEIATADDLLISQGLKHLAIVPCTFHRTEGWHRGLQCTGHHAQPVGLDPAKHPTLSDMIRLSAGGDVVALEWPRKLKLGYNRPWMWVSKSDAQAFYEAERPLLVRTGLPAGALSSEDAEPWAPGHHVGPVADDSALGWREGPTGLAAILGNQCSQCGWTRNQHHPRCSSV
jgi:hypothetical protein